MKKILFCLLCFPTVLFAAPYIDVELPSREPRPRKVRLNCSLKPDSFKPTLSEFCSSPHIVDGDIKLWWHRSECQMSISCKTAWTH